MATPQTSSQCPERPERRSKSPKRHSLSPANLRAIERQREALRLRREGYTFREIARQLGYRDYTSARYAVRAALYPLGGEPLEDDREILGLDALLGRALGALLERLERLEGGELSAVLDRLAARAAIECREEAGAAIERREEMGLPLDCREEQSTRCALDNREEMPLPLDYREGGAPIESLPAALERIAELERRLAGARALAADLAAWIERRCGGE